MVPADLVVEPNAENAARAAADRIASALRAAITARGSASVAFSGGHTPTMMLGLLAQEPLPWHQVHIFQVDERVAPDGDPERNSTALQHALLDRVDTNVYLMDVTAPDRSGAARRYAALLRVQAPLDVVHLGIGDDGHTASWPPGDPVVDDRAHDVAIVGPFRGFVRMTITPRVVNRAAAVILLVAGEDKATALARAVAGDRSLPASRVLGPRTVIVADEAAAGQPPRSAGGRSGPGQR